MPRFTRTLAAIAATALFAGVGATQVQAAPTPTVHATEVSHAIVLDAGPGLLKKYHFKTETLGAIRDASGRLGFCIDNGKKSPDGKAWVTDVIRRMKPGVTRDQMTWLANAYPHAIGTAIVEPALKASLNRLASAEFRSDWAKSYVGQLTARHLSAVVALSEQMLHDAKLYAGPVTLKGSFTKAKPGHIGTVSLVARANRHVFPGQLIAWKVTGATTSSASTKTSKGGTAVLRFIPTGTGVVRVSAVLTSPQSRTVLYLAPNGNDSQRLIRAAVHNTISTPWAGSYDSRFGVTVTQDCGAVCDGHPKVTQTATAATNPVQWQILVRGKAVKTMTISAKTKKSQWYIASDGDVVTSRYRVKVAGKWAAWVTLKDTFEVICPAWPEVTPTKVCICKGDRTAGYTYTIPASFRFFEVTTTIGDLTKSTSLTGGQSVTHTGPIKAGNYVSAEFKAYSDADHKHLLSSGLLDDYTQGH